MKRTIVVFILLGLVACQDHSQSGPSLTGPAQIQNATGAPGTAPANARPSTARASSLSQVYAASGKLALSVDGLGTNALSGIIQAEKPAGATVRRAFLAAASTGFTGRTLVNGDIQIDGTNVNFAQVIPGAITNTNGWADVTNIVKPKIDAALGGRVDFTITERHTAGIDGEVLAIVFDKPHQTRNSTVKLFFGAQDVTGDSFVIRINQPADKNRLQVIDLGLGISFGFQPSDQFSVVDVNGVRLTSCAGGQDDGQPENGALMTVGGLDDTNANPDPHCTDTHPRVDDELYNLVPFVNPSDSQIVVHTVNPSGDDGIFFASLLLQR